MFYESAHQNTIVMTTAEGESYSSELGMNKRNALDSVSDQIKETSGNTPSFVDDINTFLRQLGRKTKYKRVDLNSFSKSFMETLRVSIQ